MQEGILLDEPIRGRTKTTRKSRPMVCQLVHSLNVGGAAMLAASMVRRLQDRFRFTLVCLDDTGPLAAELQREGHDVVVLNRRQGIDIGGIRKLAAYWKSEKVQLVHAHQYTPFFYAMSSGMFGRRPPILFTEHGRWFPDYPRRKRIWFNRLMLRARDRVVGVGQSVRRALIENEGIRAGRVGMIYNGIDLAAFGDPTHVNERGQLRRSMGVGQDDLMLIHVARLDALKDHTTAVRALERVLPTCPHAKLVLVGDGPEREAIAAEIRRRSLEPHVRLLGLRNDVPQLLRAADIFFLTSVSEGIPLTVIEAMAAGLPVVTTAVGGVPEIVEEAVTGFMAPSGNDERLATAIVRLADDPHLRHELGEAGRQRAAAIFSDDKMHDSYCQLYQEMLGG